MHEEIGELERNAPWSNRVPGKCDAVHWVSLKLRKGNQSVEKAKTQRRISPIQNDGML